MPRSSDRPGRRALARLADLERELDTPRIGEPGLAPGTTRQPNPTQPSPAQSHTGSPTADRGPAARSSTPPTIDDRSPATTIPTRPPVVVPSPPGVPAPPIPPTPPTAPAPPAAPGRRRRWPWVLVLLLLLGIGMAVSGGLYARWRYGQIERVDVAVAPPGDGADVWLLVGSDSREGIDPDRPDAAALIGEPVFGQRADSIILIRDVGGLGPQMLSLPRDLWFDPPGDSNATRINGAYARGPDELVKLIASELDIDVQHYVEIDLAGLDRVIDAVGGVTLELEHPGYDPTVGLDLRTPGPVTLDGITGLAFVRSRHWINVIDGVDVADGRGDLGRVERQQLFLAALGDKLLSARNPFTVNRVLAGLTGAIRVDHDTGFRQLYSFAQQLRAATSGPALPVLNHVTDGGAHVLLPAPGAEQVLAAYR